MVSCAIPQQELPSVAARDGLVDYIVRTVRRSTTSPSFPTVIRSSSAREPGHHRSAPLPLGNDRLHKERCAPLGLHLRSYDACGQSPTATSQRKSLIFPGWRHTRWLVKSLHLPNLAAPKWSSGPGNCLLDPCPAFWGIASYSEDSSEPMPHLRDGTMAGA
ncbi:hypothetical protein N7481_003464 [Penicillium waksmanii]|uniref:uncharacterized protein n=1 Tax=Penicillium waksmanii TaxID=69791 RepID=UPI002547C655|nr:uncharacterized protein N7481_003464 [Penicillium waksmanii]KAJ5988254.1 hypothetical protein N7481_003464 [Penicillium waksmanii]